jgi:DHA3 family multidrug efflux protein-like MFS transporter
MKTFYQILGNTFISAFTNNFVWFALTFWIYLETQSVLGTAYIAGIYLVATAGSGFWLGSIVDHNKKKTVMIASSIVTLIAYIVGFLVYLFTPETAFQTIGSIQLWILVLLLMFGVLAGNIRNITLPTLVTILVKEEERDKANGMSGTIMGVSFAVTSVASGLILGNGGMIAVMIISIACTALAVLHMFFVNIPEKGIAHVQDAPKKVDFKGTFLVVKAIPGLLALILFATINNFLGGVYMSLMDPYGLSLMSVQNWGFLWGFLSLGFIVGGMIVAKKGLGKSPLRTLFLANILMWTVSIFFTAQPWIWLLAGGMFVWICLVPFAEAAEQTIIQKVVPQERQGRVFGFAQSVEQAASPLTAFMIGPIAQFFFIPFMTTGSGVDLIGDWYGVGQGRGIALVFSAAGILGLIITIIAMRTRAYRLLSKRYAE